MLLINNYTEVYNEYLFPLRDEMLDHFLKQKITTWHNGNFQMYVKTILSIYNVINRKKIYDKRNKWGQGRRRM